MNYSDIAYAKAYQDGEKLKNTDASRFNSVFGSLSAQTLELIKSGGFDEILQKISEYYIMGVEERLLETNLTNINLEDSFKLRNYQRIQDEYIGQKKLFNELRKISEALKELRMF